MGVQFNSKNTKFELANIHISKKFNGLHPFQQRWSEKKSVNPVLYNWCKAGKNQSQQLNTNLSQQQTQN